MLVCLICGGFDLDHLVNVLLARFAYGKVTVFPFVIRKDLVWRYLETMRRYLETMQISCFFHPLTFII